MGDIVKLEEDFLKNGESLEKITELINQIKEGELDTAFSVGYIGTLTVQASQSSLSKYTYDQSSQGWDYNDGFTDYITDTEGFLDASYPLVPGMSSLTTQFTLEAQLQCIAETLIKDGVLEPDGGQVILRRSPRRRSTAD